jgi:hypothetical protein
MKKFLVSVGVATLVTFGYVEAFGVVARVMSTSGAL